LGGFTFLDADFDITANVLRQILTIHVYRFDADILRGILSFKALNVFQMKRKDNAIPFDIVFPEVGLMFSH
jgi:hypothetical protein